MRGIGLASQVWGAGGGPPAQALVRLNPDGTVEVYAGTQDIGTGTRTVMSQIAAEALRVPLDAVRMHLGDTEAGPYAPLSGGSMTVPANSVCSRICTVAGCTAARSGGPGSMLLQTGR